MGRTIVLCIAANLLSLLGAGHISCADELPPVAEVLAVEQTDAPQGDSAAIDDSSDGYNFDVWAIHDFWGNTRGGNNRGLGVMGYVQLTLTIDTAAAGWWKDGEFVLDGIGVYGRRSSLSVGDYQYTSNIDAFDTFEPYQIYYKHTLWDGAGNILAGIHDFSSEFALLDYGCTFINSSFFTPSTITQNAYSFYPFTGLGTRISAEITDKAYVLAGFYDGLPGQYTHSRAKNWGLSKREGIFSVAEVGWIEDEAENLHSKVGVGFWHNSGEFEDPNGVARSSNYGSYIIGEHELWREQEGATQGLGAFYQVGYAQADRNFNPWYFGGGLRYQGVFEGRDDDILGFGYAHAESSSRYRSFNEGTDRSERTFELNYRAITTENLTLTPSIQYVVNPGTNPELDDALVLYLRTEIAL